MKEKPKYNIFQNIFYDLKIAARLEKALPFFMIATVAAQVLSPLAELFIGPMILRSVESGAPASQMLGTVCFFTLAVMLLSGASGYLEKALSSCETRPLAYFIDQSNQKACTTAYSNTLLTDFRRMYDQAEETMGDGEGNITSLPVVLGNFLTAVIGFALYIVLLTGLNPWLLVLVTVTAVAGYLVNDRVSVWAYRRREEKGEILKPIHYVSNQVMVGEIAQDVRMFGLASWLRDLYNSALSLYRGFIARREKKYLLANLADVAFALARNGVAYFCLIRLALRDGMPASQFLLYFSAVSGFTAWIGSILKQASVLRKISLNLCAYREFLEYPEPFRFADGAPIPKADAYELRLETVSYRYPEAEHDTISHMDLTIRPGEKLAIVGLNGAGKSTLVKLLCGLLDPTEGRVLLNGQDIRDFDRREYYGLFTAVFQDFSRLFASVAENVAQAQEKIDLPKVERCLDLAGMTEAVKALPKGVHTQLGKAIHDDGVELSGGQYQRLMLARALYKNAPILVLDEPTAALDPLAENDIYQKYNAMSAGRTTVFISHRLASTRFCHRILFLVQGAIAEEGTHEELLAQNGGYAQLFGVQSKYYQEGAEENGEG